jgi:DNA-binding phage protein
MKTIKIEKVFEKELENAINEIYGLADDLGWSWPTLAREAKLIPSTVYRLGHYQTKLPRLLTIQKLAKAVGLRLVLTGKVRLRKVG